MQANQIKAIDARAAKQQPAVTRPEAIRGMIDAMLHILAKDPGEKPAKKAKNPMKESTLAKITASVAVAKEMAQKR